MPQLVFADFAPQLVWLAIVFAALYLVVSRAAVPRIGAMLEQRSDKIANDLDAAAGLKRQAETALADYEAAIADARGKALAVVAQTRQQLLAEADRHKAELKQTLDARVAEAEARIAKAKSSAVAGVREMASDAASGIVAKLLGEAPDQAALGRAVDAALPPRN